MAVAGDIVHFWDPEGALCDILPVIRSVDGSNHNLSRQAWSSVLTQIFPILDRANVGSILWRIRREAHISDGADRARGERPGSIMTYKILYSPPPPHVNITMWEAFKHDEWIFIEIRAPNTHSARGWRDMLGETSSRLAQHYPRSRMFVICAIGLHYMMFFWNPFYVPGPEAAVRGRVWSNRSRSGPVEYALPGQLQPLPPAPHIPNFQPIGPNTGPLWINHTLALSIYPNVGTNMIGLSGLENFLLLVRAMALSM